MFSQKGDDKIMKHYKKENECEKKNNHYGVAYCGSVQLCNRLGKCPINPLGRTG